MKKFLFASLILCFTIAISAQNEKQNNLNKREQSDRADLELTEDQKNKIKKINEDFREEFKVLMQNEDITVGEQRDRRKELNDKKASQIADLLTDEQKEKWLKIQETRESRIDSRERQLKTESMKAQKMRKERFSERQSIRENEVENRRLEAKKRANEVSQRRSDSWEELNLSAEQKSRMEEQRGKVRESIQEIRANDALTPEEKKVALQEIRKEQEESLKAILDDSQLEKWEEMKKRSQKK